MRHTSFVCTALISVIVLAVASIDLSPTLAERGGRSAGESMLEARLLALEADVLALQSAQGVLQHVRYETGVINGLAGPHMIIEGVNVHIRDSLVTPGQTYRTAPTGLGNLVIGWNEAGGGITANDRLGSHNLIIGGDHKYTNSGCFLAGRRNTASGTASSVSGGQGNTASERYTSVSGGQDNTASGNYASVSGGRNNTASGQAASVSGGGAPLLEYGNEASGLYASVSGGRNNIAGGHAASVSAGWDNTASEGGASVSGGEGNTASGWFSSASGGGGNWSNGNWTSICGGTNGTATGNYNWAAGTAHSQSHN